MVKYEFKYVSTDNYELRYTNINGEEIIKPFKRNISLAEKIQGISARARLKMNKELTTQGITKNDLIIKVANSDGTITYDETNFRDYEKYYTDLESNIVLNEVIESCFKVGIYELFTDMGLDVNSTDPQDTNSAINFGVKFYTILSGKDEQKTPSGTNKE